MLFICLYIFFISSSFATEAQNARKYEFKKRKSVLSYSRCSQIQSNPSVSLQSVESGCSPRTRKKKKKKRKRRNDDAIVHNPQAAKNNVNLELDDPSRSSDMGPPALPSRRPPSVFRAMVLVGSEERTHNSQYPLAHDGRVAACSQIGFNSQFSGTAPFSLPSSSSSWEKCGERKMHNPTIQFSSEAFCQPHILVFHFGNRSQYYHHHRACPVAVLHWSIIDDGGG